MSENNYTSGIVSFEKWLREMDISSATGWRFRKRRWIETLNLCGRLYVTRAAILKFEERAAAGEFSKVHKTPARKGFVQ